MQILTVLTAIGRVETQVGDFYQWLSEVFEGDFEVSAFFYRLSMQERSHANLINYAKKLVHQSPRDFAEVDIEIGVVAEMAELLAAFRTKNPRPTLNDAIEMAMKIESHHAEKLHRSAVIESNPKVASLVNSLAVADQEHFELLKNFVQSRQK